MLSTLEYDRESDAVYIRLRDLPYAYGVDADHERRIDYAADGLRAGVQLLDVSGGVDLCNLPARATLTRPRARQAIRVFA